MKITQKQLRKIIIEELTRLMNEGGPEYYHPDAMTGQEATLEQQLAALRHECENRRNEQACEELRQLEDYMFGQGRMMNENEEDEFEDRFAARRASDMIDDEIMAQLDQFESPGDYGSYLQAHNIATSLDSKERMLLPLEFEVSKDNLIPKYIEGSIRGIQHISPDRRIEYWSNQGVDMRQYGENPRQVEREGEQFWEPLHITKEQLTDSEYRFLYQQLWSLNWKNYPKREKYDAEMKELEPRFKAKIAKEIQKHIDSGEIMDRNGALYAKAAPIAQEIYKGLNL